MSRPHKFIENLSAEELTSLEDGYRYGSSPDFRQRCHGVLLSFRGHTSVEIAAILDCRRQTVLGWLATWRAAGIGGLQRRPGQGRKRKLRLDDPAHLGAVQSAVQSHGQSPSQILEQVMRELGIDTLSPDTLKRFLKKTVTDGSATGKY